MIATLKKFSNTVFLNLLLIVFVSDFISKILLISDFKYHRIGLIVKGLILLVFSVDFLTSQNLDNKIYKFLKFLLLSFVVGQTVVFFLYANESQYFLNNLLTLTTYVYLPILALQYFKNINKDRFLQNNLSTLKIVSYINVVVILLNLILQLNIFKSYPFTDRFGHNGIILTASTASYFYAVLIGLLYYKFYKDQSLKNILILLLQIVISLLVGTKAIMFFVLLLILIHFLIIIKKPFRQIFRVLATLSVIGVLSFWEQTKLFIVNLFSFGPELYQKHGFITVITSTRDLFLLEIIDHLEANGNWINLLFGGIDVMKYRVEFEYVNMLLFFGVIGTALHITLVAKIFLRKYSKLKLYLFLAIILTASLAGGFFYSFMSSTFFFLLMMYIDNTEKLKY